MTRIENFDLLVLFVYICSGDKGSYLDKPKEYLDDNNSVGSFLERFLR